MHTLRGKIIEACGYDCAMVIMHIIENHIEWSLPKDCQWGHVFSDCGAYEITNGGTLYYIRSELGEYTTLDAAKQAAQDHKGSQE